MKNFAPEIETPEKFPEKRTLFFDRIRSKFLALAAAGFITLGGGWEKGFADQLKIKIPEKKGAAVEFVLETAITKEKLQYFKEKITREEPEFANWIAEYGNLLRDQHNKVIDVVLNYNLGGDDDLTKEREFRFYLSNSTLEKFVADLIAEKIIQRDHDIIDTLKKNPDLLERCREFIDNNLDEIIWSVIFLEDSREARDNKLKNIGPTEVNFKMYDIYNAEGMMAYQTSRIRQEESPVSGHDVDAKDDGVLYPVLTMLPSSFMPMSYTAPDPNVYINIFVHELVHALNASTTNKLGGLKEGITQNITLEIVQYLGEKNKDIKPSVSVTAYDVRVIVASFLESVFRSQRYSNDTLAKWHAEIISEKDMIEKLKQSLVILGLDKQIGSDIMKLDDNFWESREDVDRFKETLLSVMARLKIKGVDLSPEFLKAMMTSNRSLDDWQVDSFERIIELGSIATKVDKRMLQIKQAEINKAKQKVNK